MATELPHNLTAIDLLDWMIEQRDPHYQLAATAVLSRHSASNAIEALFLSLLYPSTTMQDVQSELESNNATAEEIAIATSLIQRCSSISGTSVVDVHVESLRPKYNNLKEWCTDPDNVYIARAGIVFVDGKRYPPLASKWCNPFTRKMHGDKCIELYTAHLDKLLLDEANLAEFKLLRDKRLGCWCKPGPCHGDIMLERLRRLV
ncbi:Domain of unknown function (DUF4326)-containing protein [uncultured virus]|nr:Domain of unknown function (DUF4326)-containing protein [uncultured virus]